MMKQAITLFALLSYLSTNCLAAAPQDYSLSAVKKVATLYTKQATIGDLNRVARDSIGKEAYDYVAAKTSSVAEKRLPTIEVNGTEVVFRDESGRISADFNEGKLSLNQTPVAIDHDATPEQVWKALESAMPRTHSSLDFFIHDAHADPIGLGILGAAFIVFLLVAATVAGYHTDQALDLCRKFKLSPAYLDGAPTPAEKVRLGGDFLEISRQHDKSRKDPQLEQCFGDARSRMAQLTPLAPAPAAAGAGPGK